MQRREAFVCRLGSPVFTLPMLVTAKAMLDGSSEITSQAFGVISGHSSAKSEVEIINESYDSC
jgi:hypothetical protein